MSDKRAACMLIATGKFFLGVSREFERDQFGLPGGKVEEGETFEDGAIREVFEETGLTVTSMVPLYHGMNRVDGYEVKTFYATSWNGIPLRETHEGVVKWCTRNELLAGPFGLYNAEVLAMFDAL